MNYNVYLPIASKKSNAVLKVGYTVVDKQFAEWLETMEYTLYASRSKKNGYLCCFITNKKGNIRLRLSRAVMIFFNFALYQNQNLLDWQTLQKENKKITSIVDHINNISLDNRVANLRYATSAENSRNRMISLNKYGFTGIHFNFKKKLWVAKIGKDGRQVPLGYFKNKYEAALAYHRASLQFYGEFAHAYS